MAYKDNRSYIAALEKTKDVVHIKKEVDWDNEVGAIVRRANETRAPATFFEKIKDYSTEYRILGGPITNERRLNIAFGFPPEKHLKSLYDEYEKRISNPVKPVVVKDGPCKERVYTGSEVDLFRFPVPMVHDGDGGRYIGTWHIVIVRDPDSEWTNWGMYRAMVHNRRSVSLLLGMSNDAGRIYFTKYASQKKPMPIAMAIGADPLCSMTAAIRFDVLQSEVNFAGGLHGEPIELVKCETSDLLVPAHAEIILEGEISESNRVTEGPFGEFTGYRTNWDWRGAAIIKAITCRKDPIITLANPGVPLSEGSIGPGMGRTVNLKKFLRACGVPVVDVYIPPEAAGMIVIVSVRKFKQANLATLVKNAILARDYREQKIIVVDEDVDVFNLMEVFHTLATRLHPGRGITVDTKEMAMNLSPFLTAEERKWGQSASVLFDCTWPAEWSKDTDIPPRVSFKDVYSSEIQEKVKREWKEYGF